MLADAAAAVLVTQSALLDRLPQGAAAAPIVVRLDADWPQIARAPQQPPRSRSTRKTPPTSSTPQDQPEPRKKSSSRNRRLDQTPHAILFLFQYFRTAFLAFIVNRV